MNEWAVMTEWTVVTIGKPGCFHPSFIRVISSTYAHYEVLTCVVCGRRLERRLSIIDDIWPEHRET